MSELWIRSQDKTELVKCEKLSACIDDYCYVENNAIYADANGYHTRLGEYAKSRCIEILDEIQCDIVNEGAVFYQMPEK